MQVPQNDIYSCSSDRGLVVVVIMRESAAHRENVGVDVWVKKISDLA